MSDQITTEGSSIDGGASALTAGLERGLKRRKNGNQH